MKLLVIGDEERTRKNLPGLPVVEETDLVIAARGTSDDEILELAPDADFIMADAISPVSRKLIEGMPNLKLIHSEGVAYNAIDLEAAKERGIVVCNNAGVNASAVAEQAIFLMLACLRHAIEGDTEVRAARQIEMKERVMVEGMREIGDCTIGFIGFGAIGQSVARKLSTWGCEMLYEKRHPLRAELEHELNASFATREEILRRCDIISLHVPVTDETTNMVDDAFLEAMRDDGILINTARGEIVDQEALARALENGTIAAAGLDTLAPEPVEASNPLLNMNDEGSARVFFSPHIGGMSTTLFQRAHKMVWDNVARLIAGEEPLNRIA